MTRAIGGSASVELATRTESREVEGPEAPSHLGSLEVLPATLLARWHPRGGGGAAFQPYLGLGVAGTLTWEKSGELNSIDVPFEVGPAAQIGADHRLAPNVSLNLDIRWNRLRFDLTELDADAEDVRVDPLAIGLGLRFGL